MQAKLPVLSDVNTETLQLSEHEDADVKLQQAAAFVCVHFTDKCII